MFFLSGVCGVGKSTICDYISRINLLDNFTIFDIDDLINIHDYKLNDGKEIYKDAIDIAIKKSDNKDIILGCCMNPNEFKHINHPDNIEYNFILINCRDDILEKRLKEREAWRKCSDENFILDQKKYQKHLLQYRYLYDLHIDNSVENIETNCLKIIEYINKKKG
jgi:broad-specificity NMP kinase